jgi:hypothetical protein
MVLASFGIKSRQDKKVPAEMRRSIREENPQAFSGVADGA